MARRALRLSRMAGVFVMLLFAGASLLREARAQSGADSLYISDMTVMADEKNNVNTVFVADKRSGAIYSATTPLTSAEATTRLEPNDFKLFFQSPEFPKPSALTYQDGKLIVCDEQNPALFEVDVSTKSINVLLKGDPLNTPSSLAIASDGRIAIASQLSSTIILYERTGVSKVLPYRFDNPSRLAFAGIDLLVLDGKGNTLLVGGESITNGKQLLVSPLVLSDVPEVKDFAIYNGTYYFIGDKQITAYIKNKGIAIPIKLDSALTSASRIVADSHQLILANSKNNIISKLSRPVPMIVSFSDSSEKSNDALISIYQYLLAHGTLPLREYIADHDYSDLEQLLLSQKVLFAAVTEKLVAPLDRLICPLNKDLCDPSPANTPTIKKRVRQGQRLVLPGISYRELLSWERIDLGKEITVESYLARSFENPRTKFDENYLWVLNELKYGTTLEAQLTSKVRGAIIASPPRKELSLGEILNIKSGGESRVGALKDCGVNFNAPKSDSYGLPKQIKNSISRSAVVEQLPRSITSRSATDRLNKLGIDTMEFELDNPNVAVGDREVFTNSSPQLRQCLSKFVSPDNYLVLDTIQVQKGRYRLKHNGSVIYPTAALMKRLGLLGHPDTTRQWSFVVDEPYYIAYRAAALNDQNIFNSSVIKAIDSPSQVKPGSSQDILQLRDTSLLLPVVRGGEITILVSESELAGKTSDFNKLKSSYQLRVRSAEGSSRVASNHYANEPARARQQTAPASPTPSPSPTPLAVVKQNRTQLLQTINYRSLDLPLEDLERVRIGIGEQPCSVDKDHPDFQDAQGANAWVNDSEITSPAPCPFPAQKGVPRVKPADEFIDSLDHGTHVAGLIGARDNSPGAPGLLPFAKLYYLDASSPDAITPLIPNAYLNQVFIINLSTDFPLDANQTSNINELKETMTSSPGMRILFVVAVENSGNNLEAGTPTSYLASFLGEPALRNNMIGVGSSILAGGSEYVLGDYRDSKGQIGTGSSYGKKYVHLIAPGYSIYSSTRDKSYAEATGASQAAPQVSATAGMLLAQKIREPERIKARLIYTADWYNQLRGKVWGGALNVSGAIWEINRNILTTESSPNEIQSMDLDESKPEMFKIKLKSYTKRYDLDANVETPIGSSLSIPFVNVLRVTRLPNGRYRVIYLDQDDRKRLKIILDAEITGKFPCKKLMTWRTVNNKFVEEEGCSKLQNVDVSQILDYVGRVPEVVTF